MAKTDKYVEFVSCVEVWGYLKQWLDTDPELDTDPIVNVRCLAFSKDVLLTNLKERADIAETYPQDE